MKMSYVLIHRKPRTQSAMWCMLSRVWRDWSRESLGV